MVGECPSSSGRLDYPSSDASSRDEPTDGPPPAPIDIDQLPHIGNIDIGPPSTLNIDISQLRWPHCAGNDIVGGGG